MDAWSYSLIRKKKGQMLRVTIFSGEANETQMFSTPTSFRDHTSLQANGAMFQNPPLLTTGLSGSCLQTTYGNLEKYISGLNSVLLTAFDLSQWSWQYKNASFCRSTFTISDQNFLECYSVFVSLSQVKTWTFSLSSSEQILFQAVTLL